MSEGAVQRIEAGIDAAASTLFAASALFTTLKLGLPLLLAAGWALLSFLVCLWLLRSIESKRSDFPVRDFAPSAYRPDPPELVLEEILANVARNSRVVRLFDHSKAAQAAPGDASQALYDALAQLRRSLR